MAKVMENVTTDATIDQLVAAAELQATETTPAAPIAPAYPVNSGGDFALSLLESRGLALVNARLARFDSASGGLTVGQGVEPKAWANKARVESLRYFAALRKF